MPPVASSLQKPLRRLTFGSLAAPQGGKSARRYGAHDHSQEQTLVDFAKQICSWSIDGYAIKDTVAHKNALIEEGGSASRGSAKLSLLCHFFYASVNGLRTEQSPFEDVKVSSKAKLEQQKRSYNASSTEDISTIFDPAPYTAQIEKPGYRRLPLLALYSGARLEELANLRLGPLQRRGRRLVLQHSETKNANSQRHIPLHHVAVESGFLAYTEGLRERSATQILPDLKHGANSHGKNIARRFADYLDDRKIVDD